MQKLELVGDKYLGIFYWNARERITYPRGADGMDYAWWSRRFFGGLEIVKLGNKKQTDIQFATEWFGADPEGEDGRREIYEKMGLDRWLYWYNNLPKGKGMFRPEIVKGSEVLLNDYILEKILSLESRSQKKGGFYLRERDGISVDRLKIPRLGEDSQLLVSRGILTSPDGQNSLLLG